MIRASTLLALIVVLGLACVFAQKVDTENAQESKSSLLDTQPKEADVSDDEEADDENVNDPKYWSRKRYRFRYRYRKSRKRRKRPGKPYPSGPSPRPTFNPPTQPPDCSTSRPGDYKWANEWQGKMFFECSKGKEKLLAYIRVLKSLGF